jgi:hypothetical protein
MKKPTGWGAGGQVVLFMVEVARVELASKYVGHCVAFSFNRSISFYLIFLE